MVAHIKNDLADSGLATRPAEAVSSGDRATQLAPRSRCLDWGMMIVSCWFVGGLFLDAWAHIHLPDLETFLTPWHGVMYTGFLAVVAYIGWTMSRNHAAGYPWSGSMPAGYALAPLGIAVFAAGGVGDAIWHELFGVEANLEAAISPTHLLLFTGMTMLLVGPVRSLWDAADPRENRLIDRLPGLLTLSFILTLFGTVTGYANPITRVVASGTTDQEIGLISIAWYSVILMAPVLLAIRRSELPFGSLTIVFGVHVLLQGAVDDATRFVPGALAAGLIADLARVVLKPVSQRTWAYYLVGVVTPVAYVGMYFLTVQLTQGIVWSIHLWTGTIALSALTTLWLSYLIAQATRPIEPPR